MVNLTLSYKEKKKMKMMMMKKKKKKKKKKTKTKEKVDLDIGDVYQDGDEDLEDYEPEQYSPDLVTFDDGTIMHISEYLGQHWVDDVVINSIQARS